MSFGHRVIRVWERSSFILFLPNRKQLCHCALVRRFDKLITVGLRPLPFGRLLELLQHRISTVLLLHKVGHALAIHLPGLLGVFALKQPNLDAMLAARATEIAAAEGGIQQRVMALLVAGYTAGNVAIPMQLDSITYTRAQVRALEQYGIPGYLGTHQISDGGMPGHDESTYLFL